MTVPVVIDMSLSMEWVAELRKHGWTEIHWATVGDPSAPDSVIMDWARANRHVISLTTWILGRCWP